jgi:purine-binding chemotaxis protein CheW
MNPSTPPRTSAPDAPSSAAGGGQYLSFALGDGVYGIDIRSVREIIQYGALTVVPLMPEFVRGVINLRGAVVPVIDLQARFGHAPAQVGRKTCIVIFQAQRERETVALGLMVDAVSAVVDIAANQIEPPPQFGHSIRREFIKGMGKVGEKFIILLEPQKALDVDEMADLARHAPALN